jgi:hypothetical protein
VPQGSKFATREELKLTSVFITALKFIEYQNDVVNNVTLFPLENLLPKDRDRFFKTPFRSKTVRIKFHPHILDKISTSKL